MNEKYLVSIVTEETMEGETSIESSGATTNTMTRNVFRHSPNEVRKQRSANKEKWFIITCKQGALNYILFTFSLILFTITIRMQSQMTVIDSGDSTSLLKKLKRFKQIDDRKGGHEHQHHQHVPPSQSFVQNYKEEGVKKVFVYPNVTHDEEQGEMKHFICDGIRQSNILERTFDNYLESSIWVIDMVRDFQRRKNSSHQDTLLKLMKYRLDWSKTLDPQKVEPWSIYFVDFHDVMGSKVVERLEEVYDFYKDEEDSNAIPKLHFGSRSQMYEREMSVENITEEVEFGSMGKWLDFSYYGFLEHFEGEVRAIKYGVRKDLVQSIDRIMQTLPYTDIITKPRPKDVTHFWDVRTPEYYEATEEEEAEVPIGQLRSEVSKALIAFGEKPENAHLKVMGATVSEREGVGREAVHDDYASALLENKIIVVCQRDYWEGHYRLMEALAGGAMVMTDPMHPLPYLIEDRKQVVVYRSIKDLERLVKYYLDHEEERLEIARSGNDIAMRFHQSREWIERLIFGNWNNEHGAP